MRKPCSRPVTRCPSPSVVLRLTTIDTIPKPTLAELTTTTYPESIIVTIAESIVATNGPSLSPPSESDPSRALLNIRVMK